MTMQLEVDIVGDTIYHNSAKPPGFPKEKLLIRGFNIIIGDAMAGMPAIAGDLIDGSRGGKLCKYVAWQCNDGLMHKYWDHYRNWLLKVGDTTTSALFKVFTVKRDGIGQPGLISGGHNFMRSFEVALPILQNPTRNTVAGSATPKDDQAGPSSAQQIRMTHETSEPKPAEEIRTRYSRAAMEEMLKSAPPGKVLKHQQPIQPAEVILGMLIVKYYGQFNATPSVEEMEDMQEEIRANGFGTRPVVTIMEDETKKVEIPDTPTRVPEQSDKNEGKKTQGKYYKQPDEWSYYQRMGGFEQIKAICNLDHAQYQPAVIVEFMSPNHPAYEDPVDKAKSKGKGRDVRDMPGGNVQMFSFRDFMKEQAIFKGDERAARVLRKNGIYLETETRAKGFDEADDEIFLKPEAVEDADDAAEEKDDPSSESKAVVHTNVAEEIQAAQTEQYSHYAGSSYNNTGYGGSTSGYSTYLTGGTQYQPTPYGGNPILSRHQSSTPARADSGFPQFGYNYSTPGQTNFNPAAASWNSGGGGGNTIGGGTTSRFNFGASGTTSTFNPNVPTFQSQVNPIVPAFRPKAIGNLPNPLQIPHGQANNPFITGGQRITSPFGLPGHSPFQMKYPVRFDGPGTPVNPNHRPVPSVGQKPKQSTPLKESMTNEDENVPPGAVGDMQYGTSMRLHNNARGSNSKSTLSAILNAEPSPSGVQASGSGQGQAAPRGRGSRRHNRGGSHGGGSAGRGGAQTG